MKKFSLALLTGALLWLQPQATAQTPSSVQVAPCPSKATLGRPVLKRHAPEPDNQVTPEPQSSSPNQQPCDTVANANGAKQTAVEIRLEGLINVPESDVRSKLWGRRLIPTTDSVADADAVAKAEEGLRQILFEDGYRRAQVSSRIDRRNQEPPVLVFLISEGSPVAISEIRFKGNRVFSSQILTEEINACLAGFQKDKARVFNEDIFAYCEHALANFERSQGYLQASLSSTVDEVAGGLIISIDASEGLLYRVGRFEIEGANHLSEQQVRDVIDMRAGDLADGEKLSKALYENLKAIYGEKGFIQYTAEIQPEFHSSQRAPEGIADFKITIDEGHKFRVHKISFRGDDFSQSELRPLLLLREGDVYNQKLFEETVRRINETGLFNFVDKDRDVDYRTNEEEDLIDVAIKITKRQPQDVSRSNQ
jgi:outer membrane protein insertion porin family